MEESETVAEEPEELVIPPVSESHGVNWTAVDVYKIFHQFNRSTTAGKERDVISLHNNISAPQNDLNQTLVAIKRTNITTNITGDRAETVDREKRSAGSAYYHQPLHISREDDISVLSVAGVEPGLQYHSILVLVGVLPLAAVMLYLVTLLVKAMRDSKLQSRERYESGESGLSQIVISQTRYEAQDRGGWQCVIRDENSNHETISVPRKRSLEKKGDGRQQ